MEIESQCLLRIGLEPSTHCGLDVAANDPASFEIGFSYVTNKTVKVNTSVICNHA